jgi:hypothetical protein
MKLYLAETVRKTSFKDLLGLGRSGLVRCRLEIGLVIGHRGRDRVHDRLGLDTTWSVKRRQKKEMECCLPCP